MVQCMYLQLYMVQYIYNEKIYILCILCNMFYTSINLYLYKLSHPIHKFSTPLHQVNITHSISGNPLFIGAQYRSPVWGVFGVPPLPRQTQSNLRWFSNSIIQIYGISIRVSQCVHSKSRGNIIFLTAVFVILNIFNKFQDFEEKKLSIRKWSERRRGGGLDIRNWERSYVVIPT